MKETSVSTTLALAAAASAIQLLPESVATALQFDRQAIAAGELWRLITGHFTHFDVSHFGWDVAALIGLGIGVERQSRRALLLAISTACLGISLAILFWQPQFTCYRGLSGIDSALFGFLAAALLRTRQIAATLCGATALLGFGAKSVLETVTGSTLFTSGAGYSPVPLAHLLGLVCGVGVYLVTSRESGPTAPLPSLPDRFFPARARSACR